MNGSMTFSRSLEIFVSYSHIDDDLRKELLQHLSLLKREGIITEWHDRNIGAGREWAQEIDKHLNSCDVILLLISANFIASDYCYGIELKRALEKHDAGTARVIPIILRDCDWHTAPFGKLNALPYGEKSIMSSGNRDETLANVARSIRAACEEIRKDARSEPIDTGSQYNVSTVTNNLSRTNKPLDEVKQPQVKSQSATNSSRTSPSADTILVFVFGMVFLVILLIIAIFNPNPSSFAYTIYRIVLTLAAAGVGAALPGVTNLPIASQGLAFIRAGGALAFFAIVYFSSPALIPQQSVSTPTATESSSGIFSTATTPSASAQQTYTATPAVQINSSLTPSSTESSTIEAVAALTSTAIPTDTATEREPTQEQIASITPSFPYLCSAVVISDLSPDSLNSPMRIVRATPSFEEATLNTPVVHSGEKLYIIEQYGSGRSRWFLVANAEGIILGWLPERNLTLSSECPIS
jgi:uncharacterized integral membrane protein